MIRTCGGIHLRRRCVLFLCLFVVTAGVVADEDPVTTEPQFSWRWGDLTGRVDPYDGAVIRGEEPGSLWLHFGGILVGDYIHYDPRNTRSSGPWLDRALLRIEGRYSGIEWRFAPDLRGIDTRGGFDEAWLSYSSTNLFRITAGVMEIPLTIEHSTPEEHLPFVGYAFPTYLSSRTDAALRLDGEISDGFFSYDLAVADGMGFTRQGERIHGRQLSARGVFYPLRGIDLSVSPCCYEIPLLSGWFASVAYSHTEDPDGPLEVAHPFRGNLFQVSRVRASESDFLHTGYGADLGPFLFSHEWVVGGYRNVRTPAGEITLDDQVTAWTVMGAVMLTGEHYDSRPFRQRWSRREHFPKRPLWGGSEPGFGAVEVAVRYSNGDIDREFFNQGLTNYTISSQEFRTFSAVINWYLVRSLRASVQVVRTLADQRPALLTGHGRDTSVLFRLQYSF